MKWIHVSNWMTRVMTAGLALAAALVPLASAGCRQDPSQSPQTTTTMPEEDVQDKPAPQPMDINDHPEAPRALPRSSEVQSWVKTGAVQVAPAEELAGFVSDAQFRQILRGYKLNRLARATYESPYAIAEVLLVEAATSEDALGIFSVENSGASCSREQDGSLRSIRTSGEQLILTAWQGSVFMRFSCRAEEDMDEARHDCEALLSRTIFGLPMADAPLLMRAVQDIQQEQCRIWVVRSTEMLARQRIPRLRQLEPHKLDQRLGLDGQAMLSVVAIEQTRGAAPIIIWLARYSTPESAKAAGDRYAQALQSPEGVDHVSFVGSPIGPFLMGTWTADQHAAREMVKLLEEVLPDAVETMTARSAANAS